MSEYQVIARKWRPQRFSDLVGQEHVVRTLMNAIRQERIAHAYLLVGPRGVGKTTTARIFAKALNCLNPQDGEPCCACESCRAVAEDRSIDVIEIDAASRNSADSMRELSEEVRHMPVGGRYKVYIIDEVHMLSKAAWNALLKTVEEPPAHVKFIFATTEAHQVLPTIVSRCQRFDLQPIPTGLILERLKLIVRTEGVRISDGALMAIARAAEGGMRDAQSLLDQMIAFFSEEGSDEIDEARVLSLFGLTGADDLEALTRSLLTNDRSGVVHLVEKLARTGRNLETLLEDLLAMLRGIQLSSILADAASVLEADEDTVNRYRALAGLTKVQIVDIFLEILSPVGRTLRDAVNKTVFLEAILFKAMREAHAVQIEDLLARLNQLRTAGELKFVDCAPSLQAHPVALPPPAKIAATPVNAPSTLPAKAQPAPQNVPEPSVTSPSLSEKKPQAIVSEEVKKTEEISKVPIDDRLAGEALYKTILSKMAANPAISADSLTHWQAAKVLSWQEAKLVLHTELSVPERILMSADMPVLQQVIQEVSGNWMAVVVLTPQLTDLETAQAAAVAATPEVVLEADPEPEAPEVSAAPAIEVKPEPLPKPETIVPEVPEEELEEEEEQEAALPADATAIVAGVEEPESDFTDEPVVEIPGRNKRKPEPEDFTTRSLIGNSGVVEEVLGHPAIQQALNLFGGQIVDIHGI